MDTQRDLSELANLPFSRVQDIERGKVKELKAKEIELLQEKFLINSWWLLTGKGEMLLKSDNNSQSGMVCEPSSSYGKLSTKDMVVVNVYPDVYASAGLGNALTDSTSHQTLMDRTLLRDVFNVRNFSNLDMIKVIGDSMAPIINDGEVLFIERGAHAKNGDTVIATLNDELYVKRFRKDPFGEWVRLESENKDFPHIELNTPQKIAMLNIIGIARSKVKVY